MTDRDDGSEHRCRRSGCLAEADFWIYHTDDDEWLSFCHDHVVSFHPSIELKAWLESGYGKPIELDRPSGSPEEPPIPRSRLFREMIDRAMDWSQSELTED